MTYIKGAIAFFVLILLAGVASANPPNITAASPTTDPTDQFGSGGGFSIVANQSGTIAWYVNSTLKQRTYGTESTYINNTAGVQTNAYNVSVTITNANGASTHLWNWTVTAVNPPGIVSYYPTSEPTDVTGTARTFSIVTNQSFSYVWWYINGTLKQTSSGGVYTASYINSTAGAQTNGYNVTAIVNNSNGNASLMRWNWTVTSATLPNTPTIVVSPLTDPLVTAIGASQAWSISSNQTVNIQVLINGTQIQYNSSVTSVTYTNSSAKQGYWNLTFNVNSTGGLNSTHINWTVANAPIISTATTAGQAGAIDIVNSSRNFNISVNQTANISWQVNGVEQQYNQSMGYAKYVNYTNVSGRAGTWTVSAVVNNSNGTAYSNYTWVVSESTISGTNISTNISNSSSRVKISVNGTLNFTLTDSAKIQNINFTFPTGFYFSELSTQDLNISQSFGDVTIVKSGQQVRLHNSTGQGANNTPIYVNFTLNLTVPTTVGDYNVTITTDTNTTGTNITVHARDNSKPYFVVANNSMFTVGTETFGTLTTTVPLIGTGNTNLTFYAPNVTGQTNFTAGYGATNASKVKVVFTGGVNGNYTIYVETNPNIVNPIIVLSAPNEMASSNLPTGIIAGGLITGATIIYLFRRRRH